MFFFSPIILDSWLISCTKQKQKQKKTLSYLVPEMNKSLQVVLEITTQFGPKYHWDKRK
jgi:hypothetical protein